MQSIDQISSRSQNGPTGGMHSYICRGFTLGTPEGGSATAVILVRDGTVSEKYTTHIIVVACLGGKKKRRDSAHVPESADPSIGASASRVVLSRRDLLHQLRSCEGVKEAFLDCVLVSLALRVFVSRPPVRSVAGKMQRTHTTQKYIWSMVG